jgi:hypothetical protein
MLGFIFPKLRSLQNSFLKKNMFYAKQMGSAFKSNFMQILESQHVSISCQFSPHQRAS